MLDADMTEARRGEVDIKDLEPGTLERMVEFIYTGEVGNYYSLLYTLPYINSWRTRLT